MANETNSDPYKSFLGVLYNYGENSEIKSYIENIYDGKKRHKYSLITSYIMKEIAPNDEYETRLNKLCENLRYYIDNKFDLDFKNKKEDSEGGLSYNEYKDRVEKLYDHINLELVRLNYSKSVENETFKRINNSDRKVQEIEYRANKIQDDINKQRNQYITILGIFASIVLAFVGGMVFSSSTLSNIHRVGTHKLILVLCFIALFFGNILFALFNFIRNIDAMQMKNNKNWVDILLNQRLWFNLFFIVIIIADILIYFDKFGLKTFLMGSK